MRREQRAAQLLPDKNAVILLYCRTGKRADKALEVLRKMGYSHVENLYRSETAPSRLFRAGIPRGAGALHVSSTRSGNGTGTDSYGSFPESNWN